MIPGIGDIVFILVALMTVIPCFIVALSRNILYSAFGLFFTLLGTSGLYFFLGSEFLAIVQVIVYIGGVTVLLLFAILLTKNISDIKETNALSVGRALAAGSLVLGIFGLMAYEVIRGKWQFHEAGPELLATYPETTLKPIGDLLMGKYLLLFEAASILLLAVLVGSLVIARRAVR